MAMRSRSDVRAVRPGSSSRSHVSWRAVVVVVVFTESSFGAEGGAGAKGRAFTLVSPSDDEAIDNIQKLTGYTIPVFDTGKAGAAPAKDAPREEREPRREKSERGGRGGKAKRTETERPSAKPARKGDDRKPAPAKHRQQDDDGPDDGWNGPMPDFLSVGFGTLTTG